MFNNSISPISPTMVCISCTLSWFMTRTLSTTMNTTPYSTISRVAVKASSVLWRWMAYHWMINNRSIPAYRVTIWIRQHIHTTIAMVRLTIGTIDGISIVTRSCTACALPTWSYSLRITIPTKPWASPVNNVGSWARNSRCSSVCWAYWVWSRILSFYFYVRTKPYVMKFIHTLSYYP